MYQVVSLLYSRMASCCHTTWRDLHTADLRLVIFTLISGCCVPASALEIRLGHNAPINDPRHQALEDFAGRISQLSKGQLTVKIFSANTIGQDHERLELMQAGLLEMSLTGEIFANFDPRWSVISMPYIWQDQSHLRRFLNSDIVKLWQAETAASSGLTVLGFLDRTPRILTTRDKPIRKIEDLDGLRIRVPQIPSYMDTWRAFGVDPTPMSSSEFYLALQNGTIDGMENPLEVMSAWRIHEVSTYISFTDHMLTSLFLVASTQFLERLTQEQREIVERAAQETEISHAQRTRDLIDLLTRNLTEKGMIMIKNPELDGFREAALSVHERYMNSFGRDAYAHIQQLAETREN